MTDMPAYDHISTLAERRKYLVGRAALKASVGWENDYDVREAVALSLVLAQHNPDDVVPRCVVTWE